VACCVDVLPQERALAVRLNEIDRPIGQDGRAVGRDGLGFPETRLFLAIDPIRDHSWILEFPSRRDGAVTFGRVEAEPSRVILLTIADVPLADQTGRVAAVAGCEIEIAISRRHAHVDVTSADLQIAFRAEVGDRLHESRVARVGRFHRRS